MVIREEIDERLERHYSDQGLRIRKVGTNDVYDDAIDLISLQYQYEETDEPIIIPDDEDAEVEDYQDALRELGVIINEEE